MLAPDRLSKREIDDLFPAAKEDPADGVFEIGLVLGGTVSAGAYTAGGLDFLVQAMDRWEAAKAAGDPAAPRHKVVLKVVTGASGGAVNGAILGRVVTQTIPPVTLADEANAGPLNPFYQVWVKKLTIEGLLDGEDLQRSTLISLCNPQPIDDATRYVEGYSNGSSITRPWLANPLTLFMTVTNLRGIPYKLGFQSSNLAMDTVNHADFVRFGIQTAPETPSFRPDEFAIITQGALSGAGWPILGEFARASGAFPIGFPARPLLRPIIHYNYRVAALPGDGPVPGDVRQLVPDWASMTPDAGGNYQFLSVDGGATDNGPVELARTELVGWLKRLPRSGAKANRAVILIDPFNEKPDLGPLVGKPLTEVILPLVMGLKDQARYGTQDLDMAADGDIFSRFMITARRDKSGGGEYFGSDAICGSGLSAFLGFMSERYRRHDYFLGRANCQKFLLDTFALPPSNPIVKGWTAEQARAHVTADGYRRLIPLVGDAATPERVPEWPRNAFAAADIEDALSERVSGVVNRLGEQVATGFAAQLYLWLGEGSIGSQMADMILTKLKTAVDHLNQRV